MTTWRWLWLLVALFACTCTSFAFAQSPAVPTLPEKVPDGSAFEGKPVVAVRAKLRGTIWNKPPTLRAPKVGEPFALSTAHEELARLLAGGGFATGSIDVVLAAGGVEVTYRLVPGRVVRRLVFKGNPLADDELRRGAGLSELHDVTEASMTSIGDEVRRHLASRGFPRAHVEVSAIDTDLPLVVSIQVTIDAGAADVVAARVFSGVPNWDPVATAAAEAYAVAVGDRADAEALDAADRQLGNALRGGGFPSATVSHTTTPTTSGRVVLRVSVTAGAKVLPSFEGNVVFSRAQLLGILDLANEADRSAPRLAEKIQSAYRRRGYHDARVRFEMLGKPEGAQRTLQFRIHEGAPVRVSKRIYPCLGSAFTTTRLDEEIDSFLEEELGRDGFGDGTPAAADAAIGGGEGVRPSPESVPVHQIYVAETYAHAVEHLRKLLESEGYMFAEVGEAVLVRGACASPSMPGPGGCKAVPPPALEPQKMCLLDANQLPLPPPPIDAKTSCVPDDTRGIECAPDAAVIIAVHPGPRSFLWDVSFDGVKVMSPAELMKAGGAALRMGEPLSLRDADAARRAILERYRDEGYAFASIRTVFEYSADKSRARLRFFVSEGEQVVIDKIFVEGNRKTPEWLIRARLQLQEGSVYRGTLVRDSYDRLALLGVFQSVSIALVHPSIPAKLKSIVVTVVERPTKYLDPRIGYSTGEGVRSAVDLGFGNLWGHAVAVDVGGRASFQPFLGCPGDAGATCNSALYDPVVVSRWQKLTIGERIAFRVHAGATFPHTFLGSAVRATLDPFVYGHDLRRDFMLTRLSPTANVLIAPVRGVTVRAGADVEANTLTVFADDDVSRIAAQNPVLAPLLRFPQGFSSLWSTQANVAFDFRDNPLGATKGWLVSFGAEYVHSIVDPKLQSESGEVPVRAEFAHVQAGASIYKKLDFLPKSPVIAFALRGGLNFGVGKCWGVSDPAVCDTYPDRLFYLGGVESTRGFFAGTLLPQDSIDQITSNPKAIVASTPCSSLPNDPIANAQPHLNAAGIPATGCGADLATIATSGGNVFINPRVELRVPAFGWGGLVFFVDAANAWHYLRNFDPWRLRYALGPGLSVDTPVGPLAFDLGFNVSRYPAFGESLMVFNFSIGRP